MNTSSVQQLPAKLRSSRVKGVGLLVMFLVALAGGIAALPFGVGAGVFLIAFGGLGALFNATKIHPTNAYLILSEEGFAYASLFRKSFVRWRDVKEFSVASILEKKPVVGWSYTSKYWAGKSKPSGATALIGAEAALADTYGMSTENLMALMNQLRSKHGNTAL